MTNTFTKKKGTMKKNLWIPQEDGCEQSGAENLANEALVNETRELLTRFLREFTGVLKRRGDESEALWTMKTIAYNILDKHSCEYRDMINTLSLDNRGEDIKFVSSVAKSLFADKITNWSRIAALAAFGAAVCQHWKQKGKDDLAEPVGEEISSYLLTHQTAWLLKNNSWEGFAESFGPAKTESALTKTLVIFAGFAGIGAALTFFCL